MAEYQRKVEFSWFCCDLNDYDVREFESHQPHTFLEYAGMLQIQGFPVNVEKSAVTGIFIFISQ